MNKPRTSPAAVSRPGPAAASMPLLRFAVTCWVPSRYYNALDAGTVLAVLRRYWASGARPAAAAAVAAIEAGGPVEPAHLQAIAAALEEDGQAVCTCGEPVELDAATDFTVTVLQDDHRADGSARPAEQDWIVTRAHQYAPGDAEVDVPVLTLGGVQVRAWVRQGALHIAIGTDDADPAAYDLYGLLDRVPVRVSVDGAGVYCPDRDHGTGHAPGGQVTGPGITLFSRSEAGGAAGTDTASDASAPVSGPARAAWFALDEGQARAWLHHAVAAYMADTYGEDLPAGLEGPRPAGELPEIASDWDPVGPGQENEVFHLVRRAVEAGIISRPSGDIDLDFEYVDDADGGYYYFLVRLGWKLKLATRGCEMRKLVEPDARGAEAALAILGEAVSSANAALEALDENAAQGGIVLTRAQLRGWAGLGRDLTGPETARLARCIPGSSVPAAIGVIVSDAMGRAPARRVAAWFPVRCCPGPGRPPPARSAGAASDVGALAAGHPRARGGVASDSGWRRAGALTCAPPSRSRHSGRQPSSSSWRIPCAADTAAAPNWHSARYRGAP